MLLQDTEKIMSEVETAATEGAQGPSPGVAQRWSFRLLMLRYHRLVYHVAWRILQDAREAEDVCQEVFIRFWQHMAQIRQNKEWLLRVTRNESLTRLRRRGRLYYSDVLPDVSEPADGESEPGPDDCLLRAQRADSLHQAVQTLPEPQRSLIILFDLEGVDGATCGRILDLNTTQVKVYLHRARKRLRKQLEHSL